MSAAPVPVATLRLAVQAINDAIAGVEEGNLADYTLERIESAHAFLENAQACIEALHPEAVVNP